MRKYLLIAALLIVSATASANIGGQTLAANSSDSLNYHNLDFAYNTAYIHWGTGGYGNGPGH